MNKFFIFLFLVKKVEIHGGNGGHRLFKKWKSSLTENWFFRKSGKFLTKVEIFSESALVSTIAPYATLTNKFSLYLFHAKKGGNP